MKYSKWSKQMWGTKVAIAKRLQRGGVRPDVARYLRQFLTALRLATPCDTCLPHYKAFATDQRVESASSTSDGYRDFILELFNDVATRTGKSPITWQEMSRFTVTDGQVWEVIHAVAMNASPRGDEYEAARFRAVQALMWLFPTDCAQCRKTLRLYAVEPTKQSAGEWAWNGHMVSCHMQDGPDCTKCVNTCAGVLPFKAMVNYYGSDACAADGSCNDVLPVPRSDDLIGRAPRSSPLFTSTVTRGGVDANARCPKWFWRPPKFFTPAGVALWTAAAVVLVLLLAWTCAKRRLR